MHVLTLRIRVPGSTRYAEAEPWVAFFRQVAERVASLPGVESAGHVSFLPMATGTHRAVYHRPDQPEAEDTPRTFANFQLITPGYFRALHIPSTW